MKLLKPLLIALSTYTILPVPQFAWTEQNMRFSICFLPAAGLPIALLLWGWHMLCTVFALSPLLFAAVATTIPLFVSGGIHMDGFIDTVDGLCSRRDRETKLAILKDPHVGAFGVMSCCLYLLLTFGAFAELYLRGGVSSICVSYPLSRCLAVLLSMLIPSARKGGMLAAFTNTCDKKVALAAAIGLTMFCGGLMLYQSLWSGCLLLTGCCLTTLSYKNMVLRHFGGVTGDTTGYFIQLCELMLLYCAVGAGVLL